MKKKKLPLRKNMSKMCKKKLQDSSWLAGCPWNQWNFFLQILNKLVAFFSLSTSGDEIFFFFFAICTGILLYHLSYLPTKLETGRFFFFENIFFKKQIVLNRYSIIKSDDRTW